MTQVVTVSPATAAYASEAYKQKHARNTPMEAAISAWHEKAMSNGDPSDLGLLNAVRPPALALAFLTSGQPHQYRPVTVSQAISEYAANQDTEGKTAIVAANSQQAATEAIPSSVSAEQDAPAQPDSQAIVE